MNLSADPKHSSCGSYLREILIEKQKKNPQFSMRSLAKLLEVQSSFLSMLLSGKRRISEDTALRFAEKLQLDAVESKRLQLLVSLEKTKNVGKLETVLNDLKALDPTLANHRNVDVDQFRVVSEWYHFPLRLLMGLPNFEWTEKNAAKALNISVFQVRQALERLRAIDLIDWTPGSRPQRKGGGASIASKVRNEALKKYHTQMLEKTVEALAQSPEERFTGTVNLALSKRQLKEVRAVLKEALEKISSISEGKAAQKEIYHANSNLFKLSHALTTKKDLSHE